MANAHNCHVMTVLPFRHIILPPEGFSLLHTSYSTFSGLSRMMDIQGLCQNLGFLWFFGVVSRFISITQQDFMLNDTLFFPFIVNTKSC